MSEGQVQWLGNIGAAGRPGITQDKFLEIIDMVGQPIILVMRNTDVIPCTCYDDIYATADKSCAICGGSGFSSGWTTMTDRAYVELRTERIQGTHQRLYTRAGKVHTIDAVAFIKAKWYSSDPDLDSNTGIKNEDFIIFQNLELMVVAVSPRYGTVRNTPVFLRIDLEKAPYNITQVAGVKTFQ